MRADLLDPFSLSVTVRTYALLLHDAEGRPGLSEDSSGSSTGRTGLDIRLGGSSGPVTVGTRFLDRQIDELVDTVHGIQEIDIHGHIAVVSLERAASAR